MNNILGVRKSTGYQEPTSTVAGQRSMEVLGEKVNAVCLTTAHWKVLECFLPNVASWNATEEEHSSLKRLEENIPELFSVL